jgi:hypothetical protein
MDKLPWFTIMLLFCVGLLYVEWINHKDNQLIEEELEQRRISPKSRMREHNQNREFSILAYVGNDIDG